ncbi:MAG: DNA recombination protein RmuC [Ignavibacterium album]|uniref:DNA recombination protein RmuC n=1 Tax=Ignavibacterium album TaxID=591197 RepID=UPI0026EBFDCA|nr:DNA recombination protein RmuC [Ignavibacterium album]MCX8105269.1 DNA recombination protein RmuC [Ignavibacterium album]
MEIIYLITGLIIGFILGFLFLKSKKTIPIEEVNKLNEEINSLRVDNGKLTERIKLLEEDKQSLQSEIKQEREKTEKLTSENSSLKSDYSNLQEKLNEQKAEIEELQQKFVKEFENLANKIFEEKSAKFTEQNKEKISEILNPLKEKISEFEKKVEESSKESIKGHSSLKEQLEMLRQMNQQITQEAKNLTEALKGQTKTQGNWGEFILESILEKSGLVKGREYFVQESLVTEDGRRQQLDVIVKLPENRNIIIDSKVSLVAYEKMISAESNSEKENAIKDLLSSVRAHIRGLSSKNYQSIFNIGTLDFVFLFIPIEGAFASAIQNDNSLFDFAWNQNIIIVSPSTLLGLLRTIENIWKQEYRNKFAIEIANESGKMYDKFVMFVQDLISVGEKLDVAKKSYSEAMKKLTDGSGTLISKAEKIKRLGAKASKSLPPNILSRADIDDENNLLTNE